jgi:hypothetical protein
MNDDKITRLRKAINSNPNITKEVKDNIITLTDVFVTTYSKYDYSYFENILSTIKITKDDNIPGYKSYEPNTLTLNIKKITEDGIDLQYLILQSILEICTHKYENGGII